MFTVELPKDYFANLRAAVAQARQRVILSAMTLRADQCIQQLLGAVIAAAERGVRVLIVADRYSFYGASRPESVNRSDFARALRATHAIIDHLTATGVQVYWVGNSNKLNPYAGRYHAKITVVDNDVWTFGGVNLSDDAFTNVDYMVHCQNEGLANLFERVVLAVAKDTVTTDYKQILDAQNTLLFDAGKPGSSIIYDQACTLASHASRIFYVSQMCPSGPLANVLQATHGTYYFNPATATGWRPDTLAQLWDGWRSGVRNYYEGHQYIHAKCVLFELKDGGKALLSGSHNFSYRGVAFGTKEIALQSTDQQLWQQLYELVVSALALAD